MARPRHEINWDEFEKLCALHCTQTEIAEWFGCSPDTIDKAVVRQYGEGFTEVFKRKSSKGKISLRRKMFETALSGNVTMMIWLSKQVLGYRDRHDFITEDVTVHSSKTDLEKAIRKDPFIVLSMKQKIEKELHRATKKGEVQEGSVEEH